MRVTIEVTDEDREVIARRFGEGGKATKESVRRWAQNVIDAELESISTP